VATLSSTGRVLDVITAVTRGKVAPMVRGLFPGDEQEPVRPLLQRSVILLTPVTIEALFLLFTSITFRTAGVYSIFIAQVCQSLCAKLRQQPPSVGLK
jgi:energy-converting hydrogenase Eha subunit A